MTPLGDERRDVAAPVSGGFIAAYVLAQFGIWIGLLTPVVLTLALRVGDVAGPEAKGRALGGILAAGAFVSLVATPIWGALSDRTRSRFGRRRPWLVGGLVAGGLGLALMATTSSLPLIGVGWMLTQAGFNAMQAAAMAILPDVIPARQQGRVSGLLGMTTTAATFAGTWITQYTQALPAAMFLAPFAVTAATTLALLLVLPDPDSRGLSQAGAPRPGLGATLASFAQPFRDRDFDWAFASRFLIMMAWAFLLTYQLFFLTDHLQLTRAAATGVMVRSTAIVAIATLVTSLAGGLLSDWLGRRKPLVFAAAAIEAAGFVLIATSAGTGQFLVGVAVASLGKGLYFGVDLALVAAILPSRQDAARDLGIFQVANTLPQSIAPAIAPALLAIGTAGATATGNYAAIYLAGGLCSLAGALAIAPVRRSR
jgi:MFS family permease